MNEGSITTRRQFSTLSMLAVAQGLSGGWAQAANLAQEVLKQGSKSGLTAGEVVERIKQKLGVPWRGGPTDTFKSGGPETSVRGIATTVMSTFEVLQNAAAAGLNMVITHEPTFWTGNDDTGNFENDALYKQKLEFIEKHDLSIWRFHDHLHARRPDMSSVGLAQVLGWDKYAIKDEPGVYVLPPIKLRDLARDAGKRLNVPALRVVGDPDMTVRRAGMMQGAAPFHASRVLPNVDVVLAGEQREWEGVEYAYDANTAGMRKGLILVGHWVSEDYGMKLSAEWIRTFVPEVTVSWLSAGDPFWRP